MVEFTLPIILQIVQTVGILVGIVYYLIIMRNSQRNQELALKAQEQALETRQAQLISFLMDRMDSVEWWTHYMTIRDAQDRTYDEWEKILQDPIKDGGFSSILEFFNKVGWLVKKGLIDMETVVENLNAPIVRVYEHATPYLREYERRTGRPQVYPNLKYLYENVKGRYYQDAQAIKT